MSEKVMASLESYLAIVVNKRDDEEVDPMMSESNVALIFEEAINKLITRWLVANILVNKP